LILLDTNICIHIINAKPAAVLQRFNGYRIGKIGICSVVAAELAYASPRAAQTRQLGSQLIAMLIFGDYAAIAEFGARSDLVVDRFEGGMITQDRRLSLWGN
jgi:tRNA(fMet)-specific endonuclease VapC